MKKIITVIAAVLIIAAAILTALYFKQEKQAGEPEPAATAVLTPAAQGTPAPAPVKTPVPKKKKTPKPVAVKYTLPSEKPLETKGSVVVNAFYHPVVMSKFLWVKDNQSVVYDYKTVDYYEFGKLPAVLFKYKRPSARKMAVSETGSEIKVLCRVPGEKKRPPETYLYGYEPESREKTTIKLKKQENLLGEFVDGEYVAEISPGEKISFAYFDNSFLTYRRGTYSAAVGFFDFFSTACSFIKEYSFGIYGINGKQVTRVIGSLYSPVWVSDNELIALEKAEQSVRLKMVNTDTGAESELANIYTGSAEKFPTCEIFINYLPEYRNGILTLVKSFSYDDCEHTGYNKNDTGEIYEFFKFDLQGNISRVYMINHVTEWAVPSPILVNRPGHNEILLVAPYYRTYMLDLSENSVKQVALNVTNNDFRNSMLEKEKKSGKEDLVFKPTIGGTYEHNFEWTKNGEVLGFINEGAFFTAYFGK